MTDLESKIQSEFASGDPTESNIDVTTEQPIAIRFSLRRIASVLAVLLLIAGAGITYFASTVSAPEQNDTPTAVKSESVETPDVHTTAPTTDTPVARGKNNPKPIARPAAAVQPVAPMTPPTPPTPVPTPQAQPKPLIDLSGVQTLTSNVLSVVSQIVTTTISVVL